jgi:hypothetical protein
MDSTTLKILDTLSNEFYRGISINELTARINGLYGGAYYKNIYDKIQDLNEQKIISLSSIGRSSIIKLNFSNYFLPDFLAEVEASRKRSFLEKRIEFQKLLEELESIASGYAHTASILLIDPEKNARLNKAEFLFLLHDPMPFKEIRQSSEITAIEEFKGEKLEKILQKEISKIHSLLQMLQMKYNVKISCLALSKKEFFEIISTAEECPLNEMLANKIAFFRPQDFWLAIKQANGKGINFKTPKQTNLSKLTEKAMAFNLSGVFGYGEMGPKIEETEIICLESIITANLLQKDMRRIEAIPALIAKNLRQHTQRKISYNLLLFLCQKYEQLEILMGLLAELNKISPNKETEYALNILKELNIKPKKADAKAIREKMRLYNAI